MLPVHRLLHASKTPGKLSGINKMVACLERQNGV